MKSIGVPKEIKAQEARVGLVPAATARLVRLGHQVWIERDAGLASGFANEAYVRAGGKIVETPEAAYAADLIVKVKEPQPDEICYLRPNQILFTYLHLAANLFLTEALLKSGVTALAYELVTKNQRLPLLEPMSEIAGRMSLLVGGYFLAQHRGGNGVLLGGVPGVLPGRVAILGGGTAGLNAARMALGLGAEVTLLEIDLERMRFLDLTLLGARTYYSTEAHLEELLPEIDLLIGAVLIPGAKAPKLLTRAMLATMRPGSVLVDIAIDQGGCAETSRPTTHDAPVFVEEGVLHYCVANMPGAYARTATQALGNATLPYLEALANDDFVGACRKHPGLENAINTHQGQLTCAAVAEAHALPFQPFSLT